MWQDTVNLFHIKADQDKRDVFYSGLAQRFRDFKTKLVSRWISLRRERSTTKKRKRVDYENKNEENQQEEAMKKSKQPPTRLPYEIWPHISKDEWEAFVAKKTTPEAVAKRAKNAKDAHKKKLHHH